MNFRLSAILIGTIFVLGVVLLVLSFTADDKTPSSALMEELAGLKASEIDTVEFEREGGGRLKIVRDANNAARWTIVEPYTARADARTMDEVITALRGAKPVAFSELSSNPAAHGLQPPGLRVVLRAGEKSSAINFGDMSLGESGGVVFVTTSARPKRPMAVPRAAVEPLFAKPSVVGKALDSAKWVNDFRAREVFPTETRGLGEDVASLTLTHGGKTLSLERADSGWKFVTPSGWGQADPQGELTAAPGTFTGVNPLVRTLTNMQAMSPEDFFPDPKPEDLERYGVKGDSPGVIKVELKSKDGETTTAFIGKKDIPATAAPPPVPGAESGKWWVRVVGQPGVIRATAADLGGLAKVIENPDPLRDRSLLSVNRLLIDGIDLAGGSTKLRKTGSPATWKLHGNPAAGDPKPATGVDQILEVLLDNRIVKSFPEASPANFAPGELKSTVRIWVDGFEVPKDAKTDAKVEPKETGKPIVLEFGKREPDGTIHVRRTLADDTQAYFLLPEKVTLPRPGEPVDLLATVNKSRLELLDKSLKTFASTVATRLSASGTVNFEVTKDEKGGLSASGAQWQFVKPEERKGLPADASVVEDMLAALANTHTATRLVDENPDAAKLAQYGLGPVPDRKEMPGDPPAPRLRVVVGLKDGPDNQREYLFGNPLPGDASLVYAKQAGRSEVFALPKVLMDKFSADLRDRAIFRFDPAQVTSVKFKGWKGVTGQVLDLHFERNKDGIWSVANSSIAGYMVDPAKVNAFLGALTRSRVKEFLTGPPTAAMGFGDDKETLNVMLTIKDRPDLVFALWSATDNGMSYFAGISTKGGWDPVIKLDATGLKTYKDSPASFAK